MTKVLDYSSGWPPPAAIKASGYAGVLRYIGTPGHGKNLTHDEAQAMLGADVQIGLVYEASAGWMLSGAPAGERAALAALADAEHCGVPVRCVYFACDVDITSTAQLGAVKQCLAGAARVLGRDRVGVYGEADVIDACVPNHAAYGWQTKAWSHGRQSGKACLLQQLGYVYPGGVECDWNTMLATDWGQHPVPEETDMPLTPTDVDDIWKHDVQLGDDVLPAWRALSNATQDAAAARISVAALHNEVAALRTQTAATSRQLDAIAVAVADIAVASGTPGAVAGELQRLLEQVRLTFSLPSGTVSSGGAFTAASQ